jgi:hypothetical protein
MFKNPISSYRLLSLKEVSSRHESDLDRAHDDMILSKMEIDKFEGCIPDMASSHRYYQDLRGYVTDLVECYDEKVGAQKLCISKKKRNGISRNVYAIYGIIFMIVIIS